MRAGILHSIRRFFAEREFLEIDTPVRIPCPAAEQHIDAERSDGWYLRTSPEFHMKRLVASGYDRVYQIGPCFRRGEQGPLHHPEFTMLEWYRAESDYADILGDTKALLVRIARDVVGATTLTYGQDEIDLLPWERISIRDAYLLHAGWDPVQDYDADRFDLDMAEKIEPALPRGVPVVLTDYPVGAGGFARAKSDDPRVAERWELYVAGLELANAYSELTDPAEQRERLLACGRQRSAAGKEVYAVDERFLRAIESGMPPSGGIALGVDRLVMLFANQPDLDGVVAFRESAAP